jgi:hypothetical protein
MFGINLKHSLATVAVAVAVVAAAGSASAGTHHSGVLYNGHAGLGASVYQHNQTDLEFLAHERCDNRGRPAEFSNRLALNDQSPQLELIQPLTGTSTHRDWLQEHGEGPHHVGIVVDSVPDAVAQAVLASFEVVQSGSGIGPHRDGAGAYIDTSDALGLMVEAVELTTEMPPTEFTWLTPGAT